jgi:hypothetical protein
MFTADQYRAKAIEYSKLLRTANGPNEVREYQGLERSFTELANNAQWIIDNHDKSLHARADATNSPEGQVSRTTANASGPREPESNVAMSWFVPPFVVPAFLILLIIARAGYSAFS